MIQANELRIGNWVMINGKPIYMDAKMFHAVIHGFDGYTSEPIPLTPEILEKCGFVKKDNRDFKKDNWFFWGDGYLTTSQVKPILYLHKLQNIYFALTDEELTVNL